MATPQELEELLVQLARTNPIRARSARYRFDNTSDPICYEVMHQLTFNGPEHLHKITPGQFILGVRVRKGASVADIRKEIEAAQAKAISAYKRSDVLIVKHRGLSYMEAPTAPGTGPGNADHWLIHGLYSILSIPF